MLRLVSNIQIYLQFRTQLEYYYSVMVQSQAGICLRPTPWHYGGNGASISTVAVWHREQGIVYSEHGDAETTRVKAWAGRVIVGDK